jgi:general secretion pathway protein A
MEQQFSDEGGRQSYIDDAFVPIDQQDNNVGFVRQQKTAKPIQIMTALAGFTDQASAFTRLYLLWGTEVAFSETDQPCSAAEDFGMSCYSNPGNLADIANLNRPVFVDFEIAGKPQNLLLTAIHSQTITLVGTDTEFHVNRADFLSYWDGQYTLLWRLPPGYETPTMIGDQGETVAWLSDQLAFIDLQPKQKTTSLFNRELEERVKRFQVSVGLLPDGRVGPQTWIHINSIQAQGVPLLNSPFYIGGQG